MYRMCKLKRKEANELLLGRKILLVKDLINKALLVVQVVRQNKTEWLENISCKIKRDIERSIMQENE